VAVDSGADTLISQGIMPEAVIGDMDSVSQAALSRIAPDRIHKIDDQVTTDFDKTLRNVGTPVAIGVGFTGGRIDHQLGVFHTLVKHAAQPCILLCPDEIIFACPREMSFDADPGDVVSLFPMATVTGRSTGLRWCIDGLTFDPATFVGTSNSATGPVHLQMDDPAMLVILKRGAIRQVAQQLAALPPQARWSVP
jgi:thiamine pyrophosphokinase